MPDVELRPMLREDLPLLQQWLCQPHVMAWWRGEPKDLASVEAKYGPCIDGDDPTELFVIESSGRPVGLMQRYLMADEDEWSSAFADILDVSNCAGIDYLIGEPDAVGRGIGTKAIAMFVSSIFTWRPVGAIVVTVEQSNPASWRVLERVGFSRVWAGELDSPDPSDDGPEYVYVISRTE